MPQANLLITTAPREQFSQIGMPGGERGLATTGDSAAAEWLARRTPEQANESFRSQALRHGIEIKVSGDLHFPANGPAKRANLASTVKGSAQAIQGFLSTADKFFSPAQNQTIEGWLAELDVITAKRADDEITGMIRLRAYAKRLAEYPADIARASLLGRTWRFFPTWDELDSACRELLTERKSMLFALRNFKETQPIGGITSTVTPEARERVKATLEAFRASNAAAQAEQSLKPHDGVDPFERSNQFFGRIDPNDPRLADIPDMGTPFGWNRAGKAA